MNTALDLLSELQSLGIELSASGNRLHVRAPAGVVTYALRERLAAAKPDLLRLLADGKPEPSPLPPRVWIATIDGQSVWIIDPDHCDHAEQLRRLRLRFYPSSRITGLRPQGVAR